MQILAHLFTSCRWAFFLGKVMKTKFGKFLEKLRIDHDERLSDMARKLKVSSSFLSNVENGKQMFPSRFCAELCMLYNLEEKQKLSLMDAVICSVEEYRSRANENKKA
jgi:transcriptional regulator with XRE-family HTH domain